MSVERYRQLGFEATVSREMDSVEAVQNMRAGHHGEDLKRQWEPFAHLSGEDATCMYDVRLDLRR